MIRILWAMAAMAMLTSLPTIAAAEPRHLESQNMTTFSAGVRKQVSGVEKPETVSPEKTAEETSTARPMHGPVRMIVIDPGHGGTNEGAIGVAGVHEKHLTLQIAQLLADRLRAALPDTQIVLTRHRDESMSLASRIDVANRLNADLFISLHFNSSTNPEAIGFESFWVGDFWEADMVRDGVEITDEIRASRTHAAELGELMAQYFNHAMRHRFDVLDRGVKPGNYTVLTQAEVPAVVLELAFLSHAQEGISTVYADHRKRLVDALTEAVLRYSRNSNLDGE